jgi:hypothetical protein
VSSNPSADSAADVRIAAAPHSWALSKWPKSVYPNSSNRARYLFGRYRDELVNSGCVSRVGIDLVFLGHRYSEWLAGKNADVEGFVLDRRKRMWPDDSTPAQAVA